MTDDEKILYWLNLADYDFETAKAMLTTKRYLYVGFMCHQTIEKALKAVVTKITGSTPPKVHNLIRLANAGELFDDLTEEQQNFLISLNPLNIEARYPEQQESIASTLNDDNCTELLNETEVLLCWIKQRLTPPSTDTQEQS
ncbi:MAG: HEPN domain-containing protein [Oscillospiraceae bacterium]|nr:HEPN domain-containing protein [Oscillospiraceae bacterium]